jgi:catechol 2,3-dioxygenase-like lactoylglutathione lyase family enzyme
MIKINHMMHTGLIITNLAKSRAFYEGVLGLTPNPNRPDFGFEGVWYDIGQNQVHLMVVPNPYADVVHPEHGGRDIHVAFSVDDVEPVRAELEKAGIPYTMSKSGRAALFCRDPDGNAFEFSAVK